LGNWFHKENPERGTVNSLSNYIYTLENSGKIYLPNLRETDRLYLFSDYSGSKDQQLISYSVLILDENSFSSFAAIQKQFWENYSLGTRIIDYKSLNDVFNQKALVPFLQLCNHLNGLILSVLFNKNTKSIYKNEKPEYLEKQISVWRSRSVQEKFLRLRELILTILNGLGGKSKDILWITDNDDIVANSLHLETANTIMKETLIKHLDFEFGSFDIKTLDSDTSDRCLEKLCSVADLVAGTLVDYVGDYHKMNLIPKQEGIVGPISHSKHKFDDITDWLIKDEEKCKLKKVNIMIEETGRDGFDMKALRFPYL
jgi:hypothetical protein